MISIKRGTSRTAVIIGELFVLKVPRLRIAFEWCLEALKVAAEGDLDHARDLLENVQRHIRLAVFQNRTEYRTWRNLRAPFLVPVHFSFGVLNIQAFGDGQEPKWEEVLNLMRSHAADIWMDFNLIDPHTMDPGNFRVNHRGFRLIDYGDTFYKGRPLSWLLKKHREELERTFKIVKSHPPLP